MQEKNQKAEKKKFGWGYIVGSLVLGAAAMVAMPAIINGLADKATQKNKFPIPDEEGPVVVKKNQEETQNGER